MAASGNPTHVPTGSTMSLIPSASGASTGSSPHRRLQRPVAKHANRSHSSMSRRVSDAPLMRRPQRRRQRRRGRQTPSNGLKNSPRQRTNSRFQGYVRYKVCGEGTTAAEGVRWNAARRASSSLLQFFFDDPLAVTKALRIGTDTSPLAEKCPRARTAILPVAHGAL